MVSCVTDMVRRSVRTMLVVMALGGCKPGARVAVPSCPGGAPVETNFYDHVAYGAGAGEVGEAGGVTWVLGSVQVEGSYRHALAHLDRSGGLVITPIEMIVDVAAASEDRIWLFASHPARWAVVDVRDPDAPVVGAEVTLALGVTEVFANDFAVGSRRAVVVQDRDSVVTVDTATGVAVAPPQALPSGFESLHAECADDRCVVVGVVDRYDDMQVVAVRVRADGTTQAEPLSPRGISRPFADGHQRRVFVGWLMGRHVQLRALDVQGRGVARSSLSRARGKFDRAELFVGVDALSLAVDDLDRWDVAEVRASGRLGRRRVVPGADRVGLLGAPLDDGLALFNLSDSVDHVTSGSYSFHNWETTAKVGFVAAHARDPRWREVAAKRGDGSEGSHVRVLTRPGAAAVLQTWHGGISNAGSAALFVPLRVPCRADSGGHRDD